MLKYGCKGNIIWWDVQVVERSFYEDSMSFFVGGENFAGFGWWREFCGILLVERILRDFVGGENFVGFCWRCGEKALSLQKLFVFG